MFPENASRILKCVDGSIEKWEAPLKLKRAGDFQPWARRIGKKVCTICYEFRWCELCPFHSMIRSCDWSVEDALSVMIEGYSDSSQMREAVKKVLTRLRFMKRRAREIVIDQDAEQEAP